MSNELVDFVDLKAIERDLIAVAVDSELRQAGLAPDKLFDFVDEHILHLKIDLRFYKFK